MTEKDGIDLLLGVDPRLFPLGVEFASVNNTKNLIFLFDALTDRINMGELVITKSDFLHAVHWCLSIRTTNKASKEYVPAFNTVIAAIVEAEKKDNHVLSKEDWLSLSTNTNQLCLLSKHEDKVYLF